MFGDFLKLFVIGVVVGGCGNFGFLYIIVGDFVVVVGVIECVIVGLWGGGCI